MKPDVRPWDWARIFLGNAPPWFSVEVLFRTLLVYFVLILVLRFLGKRMAGQITNVELSVMIMLGAIVAVPIQIPDRGLFQGILILFSVLFLQRRLNRATETNSTRQHQVYGSLTLLVKDGLLELDHLRSSRISKDQIFAVLRQRKVRHLGEVKRLYLEACGLFSLYRDPAAELGLSVLPKADVELDQAQPRSYRWLACSSCGKIESLIDGLHPCVRCGTKDWDPAIEISRHQNSSRSTA